MTCPRGGPCEPFVTEADLCCLAASGMFPNPCLTDGEAVPQDVIDFSITAASELMWAQTGRRYGVCEVTVRPCKKSCNPCGDVPFFNYYDFYWGATWGAPYYPYLDGGVWFNWNPCNCGDECFCHKAEQIELPSPICEIIEVQIDGAVVPASSYRVDSFKYLVRTDGEKWPRCQSAADLGEEGTFGVTLSYGRQPPALLKLATAELACQLIKSCVGAPCQLPQRMSTMTRQGVTIGFIDPAEFFADRRTGIYLVDLAVQTFNPHRLTRRPTVYSPDVSTKWRRTDT